MSTKFTQKHKRSEQLPLTNCSSYCSSHISNPYTYGNIEKEDQTQNVQLGGHMNPFGRNRWKKYNKKGRDSSLSSRENSKQNVCLSQKFNNKENISNGNVSRNRIQQKNNSKDTKKLNLNLTNLNPLKNLASALQFQNDNSLPSTARQKSLQNPQYHHTGPQQPKKCLTSRNPQHSIDISIEWKLKQLQQRIQQTQTTLQKHLNQPTLSHPSLHPSLHPIPASSSQNTTKVTQLKQIYKLLRDDKIVQSQFNEKIVYEIDKVNKCINKVKEEFEKGLKNCYHGLDRKINVGFQGVEGKFRTCFQGMDKQKQMQREKQVGMKKKMEKEFEKVWQDMHQFKNNIEGLSKKLVSLHIPFQLLASKPSPQKSSITTSTLLTTKQAQKPFIKLTQQISYSKPQDSQSDPQSSSSSPSLFPSSSSSSFPSSSFPSSSLPSSPYTNTSTYQNIYYIDHQGYILDQNMYYLVNQNNMMIQIQDWQLSLLNQISEKK